jgi:hypothetical protein
VRVLRQLVLDTRPRRIPLRTVPGDDLIEATQLAGGPKSAETHLREWRAKQAELDERYGRNWNRPVIPVHIEESRDGVIFDGTNWRPGLNVTYGDYDIGRLREGRVCLRCQTAFEQAFPEACNLCGYAVRDRQAQDFAAEFEGSKHIGPTTTLSDEYERMLHNGQKKRHVGGSQIIVPSWSKPS